MDLNQRVTLLERAVRCLRCNSSSGVESSNNIPVVKEISNEQLGISSNATDSEIKQALANYLNAQNPPLKINENEILFIKVGENSYIINGQGEGDITNTSPESILTLSSPEKDTLQSVIDRGNTTSKDVIFTTSKQDYSYNFGYSYNLNDNFWFSNKYSKEIDNSRSIIGNIFIGKDTGALFTKGIGNYFIGNFSGSRIPSGDFNTLIGHASGYSFTSLTLKDDISAISPIIVNEVLYKYRNLIKSYDSTTNSYGSSFNTIVGSYNYGTTNTARRAFMCTVVGAGNGIIGNNMSLNNVIIGANNYVYGTLGAIYNSIVIGNNIDIVNGHSNYPTYATGTLSIGTDFSKRVHGSETIIFGILPNKLLKFNAPVVLNTSYTPNAQGDSTFTKQLVAKDDGTIGLENKENKIKKFILKNDVRVNSTEDQPQSDLYFSVSAGKTYRLKTAFMVKDTTGYGGVVELIADIDEAYVFYYDIYRGNVPINTLQGGQGICIYDPSVKSIICEGLIKFDKDLQIRNKFRGNWVDGDGTTTTVCRGSYIELEEII